MINNAKLQINIKQIRGKLSISQSQNDQVTCPKTGVFPYLPTFEDRFPGQGKTIPQGRGAGAEDREAAQGPQKPTDCKSSEMNSE